MRLKNILYTGIALLSLTACNDYLDVEAPSKYTEEFVFGQRTEMQRALNGVYAQALVGDLYGNAYQRTFILNSDVDIQISSASSHAHNTYSRFDCDDQGGDINKFWTAAYNLIEYANRFVLSAERSPLYNKNDKELMQWIGEAKCLRAMAYHDLVVMFGDVPFTFETSAEKGSEFVTPIADRLTVQDAIINDLKEAATYMSSSSSVTVEHCSKEFAQAMVARIALTAGGYSLRPDKTSITSYGTMERPENYLDYYAIARDYADSVIVAGTHSLKQSYRDVFVNQCNYNVINDDDVIFELPFAKESTGNTGYIQGPSYSAYEGNTVGSWGATSGNGRLNAFYRFLFRDNDLRREFVNGLWYYGYFTNADGVLADSVYIRNDYSVHNNKWSKLWTAEGNALGSDKSDSPGINYPYMRYADVLLMYAEAANEIDGLPSDKAIECLTKVHNRAFLKPDGEASYLSAAAGSKEAFLKAVLDERKWEFAGENSRWRDLVRTNTYAEELVYCFLRYYSAAMQNAGGMTGFEDAINEHDGKVYIDELPERIYYHTFSYADEKENISMVAKRLFAAQFYGTPLNSGEFVDELVYPNTKLPQLRVFNAYKPKSRPATGQITNYGFKAKAWNTADFYQWGDTDSGTPKDQCKYSFFGFMRADDGGNIYLIRDGVQDLFPSSIPDVSELPVVRYILPYPNQAIQRSAGAYKNYYGY